MFLWRPERGVRFPGTTVAMQMLETKPGTTTRAVCPVNLSAVSLGLPSPSRILKNLFFRKEMNKAKQSQPI